MKPILGVLGGIGSGKSFVAAEMARRGGHLINADALGHEALKNEAIKKQVVARWGREILDSQGEVQRRALGQRVFADLAELRALESMVFPFIGRRILEEVERARRDPLVRFMILDAAVMMEAGWDQKCDRVIFVEAPHEVRLRRLQEKRGWTAEEVERREKAQWSLEIKRRRADAVIVNDGPPDKVTEQVQRLLNEWSLES